ncbi:hypothetical protein SARC_16644, partial [Sphaeroforma arctica JP610]
MHTYYSQYLPTYTEPREKRAPRNGGLNAFVEKKHTLEQRQGLLSNANKDNTNKLASAGAGSLFGRLAGDGNAKNRTANQKPPPREVPLEERQGKLETTDKAKAKELESGAATRALFGRLAGERSDNTTNAAGTGGGGDSWGGGWGGWATSAWSQASSVVSDAATAILLDGPVSDNRTGTTDKAGTAEVQMDPNAKQQGNVGGTAHRRDEGVTEDGGDGDELHARGSRKQGA